MYTVRNELQQDDRPSTALLANTENQGCCNWLAQVLKFREKFYPDAITFEPPDGGNKGGEKTFFDAMFRKDSRDNLLGVLVVGKKRHLLRHVNIKRIILPRQARDKHRENSKQLAFP